MRDGHAIGSHDCLAFTESGVKNEIFLLRIIDLKSHVFINVLLFF